MKQTSTQKHTPANLQGRTKPSTLEAVESGGASVPKKLVAYLDRPLVTTIVAASMALITTAAASLYGSYEQSQRELKLQEWQKKEATFTASIELANRIAAALYEVGSFLETSQYHPDRISSAFDAHEIRMKELMPPIIAAHVGVAARDYQLYSRFKPLIEEVTILDACLTAIYRKTDVTRLTLLNQLFNEQRSVLDKLADGVSAAAVAGVTTEKRPIQCPLPLRTRISGPG